MENFKYFFELLTTEATIEDHFKVESMPKHLQQFASLDQEILEKIIKTGITLEMSNLNLPQLYRGDFEILREMTAAKKAGFLILLNGKIEEPYETFLEKKIRERISSLKASPQIFSKLNKEKCSQPACEICVSLNYTDESEILNEEFEYSPKSPARPFFCDLCNKDYCTTYHLPQYQ